MKVPSAPNSNADKAYHEFLDRKSHLGADTGFEPLWLPKWLFPFQRHLVAWALRKGRAAVFADCGLGKTPMQLVWAENVVRKTGGRVLILTPLAVSGQTIAEGEKFGIPVSRDPAAPIVVSNYERLHHFRPEEYVGFVGDECLVGGTMIDTADGPRPIETIQPGDGVKSAAGWDRVVATRRRQLAKLVRITMADGRVVECSEHHPFFSMRGLVGARMLKRGDYLYGADEAVRVVRGGLLDRPKADIQAFLRDLLLSEMADEPAGDPCAGSFARSRSEERAEATGFLGVGIAGGAEADRTHPRAESHGATGRQGEGVCRPPRDGTSAQGARRERSWADAPAASPRGITRAGVGHGVPDIARKEAAGLSDMLQGRSRPSGRDDRGGDRWNHARRPEGQGSEENGRSGGAWVERVEVLESRSLEFRAISGGQDTIALYDLEVRRHPSFSVSGILVHNSSILKHYTGETRRAVTRFVLKIPYRLLATATPAPNDWSELGTSSEVLGALTNSDMLEEFFRELDWDERRRLLFQGHFTRRISLGAIDTMTGRWRLKGHAVTPFWRWVASWAQACRKPSDLGPFNDAEFTLPPLIERDHVIAINRPPEGLLFTLPAISLRQELDERRRGLEERCAKVAELVDHKEPAIIWCLPAGSAVILGDGTRTAIEKLGVDDPVRGGSGAPRKVLATWSRPFSGDLSVLRVRGISEPIRLTPEHPVMTPTGWVAAGNISQGAFLLEPHTNLTSGGDYLGGWLVGLYLAEGGRVWGDRGQWNRIDLALHRDEGDFVTERLKEFGVRHVGHYKNGPTGTSIRLGVSDARLRRLIEETVNGHLAMDKRLRGLPTAREFARGILDGWLWGDGWTVRRSRWRQTGDGWTVRRSRWGQTASSHLAWQMFAIAGSLGFATWIGRGTNRPGPLARAAGIRVGNEWWRISAGRFVKSTQPRLDDAGRGVWREVVSAEIEPYSGTVHDVTVEADHSFLAGGIVVSNCHLNAESTRLAKLIPDAVEVYGTQTEEEKTERVMAFARGHARVLITKPKIAGLGLNFQHCAHVVTFATHSFESYYQCVRRCWRYGQRRPVTVDVVWTEGEIRIKDRLRRKCTNADEMFSSITAHMRDARAPAARPPNAAVEAPAWLGCTNGGVPSNQS